MERGLEGISANATFLIEDDSRAAAPSSWRIQRPKRSGSNPCDIPRQYEAPLAMRLPSSLIAPRLGRLAVVIMQPIVDATFVAWDRPDARRTALRLASGEPIAIQAGGEYRS